ncbi:helix-turn-helix domain-containing protein [Marinobacter sp.]|jgi:DNA-binding HxlR family transcriptional regulator|uniref:winged helix-turn-helix transcriptional regulator n=1 Tax=Marinobacter sp. TaxID=50741 RepID=UPI000C3D34F4|nr:helix-turn-helix domain-containing protein [Marinobacter sp.]MBE95158.1 transcriptional regulator [Marinobacter sp.]|tara:strand:- start:696 stop:1187 length:492 start_codon:yes stop_codon:yes gene_type:complete
MAKPHTQTCPIAAFLNVFGDAWTLMIIREAFYGATRFTEFQRNTGAARNLLSDRLAMLVSNGVLERQNVGEQGTRYAYRLTDKGQSLVPVLVAMMQWSNAHMYDKDHAPVELIDRQYLRPLPTMQPTNGDGNILGWADILAKPGPGANSKALARIRDSRHGTP